MAATKRVTKATPPHQERAPHETLAPAPNSPRPTRHGNDGAVRKAAQLANEREAYFVPYDPSADIAAALLFGAVQPRDRVLEMGCGTGDDAMFLAEAGCDVTAFDVSKTCVAYAQARCEHWGIQCSIEQGDHEKLAERAKANETFEVVSDRLVFSNFIYDPVMKDFVLRKKYLSDIAHLIRDGGLFFLRIGTGESATGDVITKHRDLSPSVRAVLDELFQPVILRRSGREHPARRTRQRAMTLPPASRSGRWMPMRPLRGGYALAAQAFLLERKKD